MAVRRHEELIAWQMADAFKAEVVRVVRTSPEALRDIRFSSQLLSSARSVSKNIAEGFARCSPGQFAVFLGYALGSLREAEGWLRDGIESRYFEEQRCSEAFRYGKRCLVATIRLKHTQDARKSAAHRQPPPHTERSD